MSEQMFTTRKAVEVLHQAGLLEGVYLSGGEKLSRPDFVGEKIQAIEGAFLGAALDNRQLSKDQLFVALSGEKVDGRHFAPVVLAAGHWVLTRPVPGDDDLKNVASRAGVMLSNDPEAALAVLAAHWRGKFDLPVIGITGSNGKTTTKDLVTALVSAGGPTCATRGNFNNRLGLPLTLLELREEHSFAVVEMGASGVGHIAHLAELARPTIAVITNAGQAHLEEFGSLERIIQGKGEILDVLTSGGRAVLNTDSPGFEQWVERAPCPVVSFGQTEGDYLWSWQPEDARGGPEITLNDDTWPVPLPGIHNGANLVAAIVAARAAGLSEETIRSGLAGFRPSEHRSLVLEIAGRTILDDSYNANPVSMVAAAQAVVQLEGAGQVLAVLGHMAELGPDTDSLHRQTGEGIAAEKVTTLLAVGPQASLLAEGFTGAGGRGLQCASLAEAAAWLVENTLAGDRILIKGSRSAGMEQLIPLLEKSFRENDTAIKENDK